MLCAPERSFQDCHGSGGDLIRLSFADVLLSWTIVLAASALRNGAVVTALRIHVGRYVRRIWVRTVVLVTIARACALFDVSGGR